MNQEEASSSSSYLEKDFDPNILTKPQLRSILLSHGVVDFPPPTAKKEVLIELFNKHIKAKREEILKARAKIKPSIGEILFLDEQSRPSPSKPRSKKSPNSKGIDDHDENEKEKDKTKNDNVTTESRSRSKTPSKRGKKSPLTNSKSKTRSRSRSRSKTPSKTRSKEVTAESTPTKSTKSALAMNSPLLNLSKCLPTYADSPKTITNKLQSRLGYIERVWKSPSFPSLRATDHRVNGSPRPSSLKGKIASFILQMTVILISILIAFYIRYQWIYPYPYCLSGQSRARQDCIPCPEHGKCSLGQLISCDEGYIKRKNIFSFGHHCQPDWKKIKAADLMKRNILTILNDHQRNIICKGMGIGTEMIKKEEDKEKSNKMGIMGLSEDAIKNKLKERKDQWDSDLFKIAMNELGKSPEKAIKVNDEWQVTRVHLGIVCRIKLKINNFLYQYEYHLIFLIVMVIVQSIFMWKWKRNKKFEDKARGLYHAVLQILAEQDAIHQRDPTHPSTLSVHQLRDALIAANHQMIIEERLDPYKLWDRVSSMIRENTNVRESIMMIRGEEHGVWEWIGIDVFKKLN